MVTLIRKEGRKQGTKEGMKEGRNEGLVCTIITAST
jgi:hypothetical protein